MEGVLASGSFRDGKSQQARWAVDEGHSRPTRHCRSWEQQTPEAPEASLSKSWVAGCPVSCTTRSRDAGPSTLAGLGRSTVVQEPGEVAPAAKPGKETLKLFK